MNILTVENKTLNLDNIPDQVEDLRYCVLSCSDFSDIDYYFTPLTYLESFFAPAAVLQIGNYSVNIPLDWSLVVCDEEYTAIEIIPVIDLNERGFHTPVFNPMHHMFPMAQEINLTNIYADVKWYFPKLKPGNILVVPLEDGESPNCMFFVKETAKIVNFDASDIFF